MSIIHKIVIKDAGERGEGIFSTVDFNKGDLVCRYGGKVRNIDATRTFYECQYQVPVSNDCHAWPIILDGMLIGTRELMGSDFGSLANDFAKLEITDPTNDDLTKQEIDQYIFASKEGENVYTTGRFIGGCLNMYATKDIKAGEQIFYSYGVEYWAANQINEIYSRCYKIKNMDDLTRIEPQVRKKLIYDNLNEINKANALVKFRDQN